jgi:hypothetical protein
MAARACHVRPPGSVILWLSGEIASGNAVEVRQAAVLCTGLREGMLPHAWGRTPHASCNGELKCNSMYPPPCTSRPLKPCAQEWTGEYGSTMTHSSYGLPLDAARAILRHAGYSCHWHWPEEVGCCAQKPHVGRARAIHGCSTEWPCRANRNQTQI